MKYKLKHKTSYVYAHEVHNYQSILCMQPRSYAKQICTNFKVEIEPRPTKIYSRTDYFGNVQHYFSLHETHKELTVTVSSDIEVLPNRVQTINPISCRDAIVYFTGNNLLKVEILQYQLPSLFVYWDQEIIDFARTCIIPEFSLYDSVLSLVKKIYTEFKFKTGSTSVNTPLSEVLQERKGVCQDFSHLAISCLRSVGIPAKYVSGYIETLPPKGKPKLEGSDASHAWIAVYIPKMGWCEFDPTNNLIPDQRHIVTAYGRDFADISPLKGIIFSSGNHKVKVEVDVIRF